ncbi:MAG: hypothetical protein ACYDCY_13390 [Metallibacterium sp.]
MIEELRWRAWKNDQHCAQRTDQGVCCNRRKIQIVATRSAGQDSTRKHWRWRAEEVHRRERAFKDRQTADPNTVGSRKSSRLADTPCRDIDQAAYGEP